VRRLTLAAVFLLVSTGAVAQEPPTRIARVEAWLKATLAHEPGTLDDAAESVAVWPTPVVRKLWVDVYNLVLMMRNPRIGRFDIRQPGQRAVEQIRYTPNELRRLRILACAAGGSLRESACINIDAAKELDADLRRLAHLADEAKMRGDANYILRRGALLHADIGMRAGGAAGPVESSSSLGPQRLRMNINDGLGEDLRSNAPHWEVARMLLDHVRPAGAEKAAPGRDEMVRQWYRATAAWMQSREDYETLHIDRAQQIFPDDPDILFLSGCLHEAYAGSRVQSAVQSAVLPTGIFFDLKSDRAELRLAEGLLKRTVTLKPDFGEARLHLGRVSFLLGKPAEAAGELTRALESTSDELLRYYGELFLGAAREALGELDLARAWYTRAAQLQPSAQSPHLALSALARRRGDRDGALEEIRRVFELSARDDVHDDPWWRYQVSHARDADELYEDLIRPFVSSPGR
jgi:tetratricopeptide (TPR) repeat protein